MSRQAGVNFGEPGWGTVRGRSGAKLEFAFEPTLRILSMKTMHFLLVVLVASAINAQTLTQTTNIATLPTSTVYAVGSRSANSTVWQQTTYDRAPDGVIIT